ncbi:MAG: SRPBCC family protein [Candidatus Dormibacteraeota bacterium]|uniref:SRPBCC family protein n=1 Tax=Candidatus Dormiibacter inghamiae TaxID=3127013 RepID=A0A934KDC5_9BACT|nr:SRPBCC family protein [Candidatus Dormibacteraeota bacterium]MBJ7606613.1 SRPBCC family protein [Candidatus Dormibacteraeota bacterium]
MQIENELNIGAPPDEVYAFLLDVNRVAGCMPGAELTEVVDPSTFRGKVKIKVGPITVSYNGTARLIERDEASRTAKIQAEGKETTGSGSARATATMTVLEAPGGSLVKLMSDFNVAGRVANFGRGVMEDISRRLVGQMGDCIKAHLEAAPAAASAPAATGDARASGAAGPSSQPAAAAVEPPVAAGEGGEPQREAFTPPAPDVAEVAMTPVSPISSRPASAPVTAAKPVNAFGLLFSVVWERLKGIFRRR